MGQSFCLLDPDREKEKERDKRKRALRALFCLHEKLFNTRMKKIEADRVSRGTRWARPLLEKI